MAVHSTTKRQQGLRTRRHRRIRMVVRGTASRPRLSVFRSGKHFTAQLIDDGAGKTLCAVMDTGVSAGEGSGGRKEQLARAIGKQLAEKAKTAGVTQAVFDRGGYRYHGRVKAVADGARSGGLQF